MYVRSNIMLLLLLFKKYNLEDSIIVCGEPRSGTTWLLELLLNIPNTFTHWEPLHPETGVVPKTWNWGRRVFILKEDNTKAYFCLIRNILTLNLYTKKTIWYWKQSISSLFLSKIVITKFVRANLLLPYITNNFKFKNKPILIIRHPIDSCLSIMKAPQFKTCIGEVPDWLNNERYLKEADYLQSLNTLLEYNVAMWCINNCPLLEDKSTLSKLNIVFYSDLVLNPEKEIRIILDSLSIVKKTDIENILNDMNFRKASITDFQQDFMLNPEEQLNKNIAGLTAREKKGIQQVFDHFDFKLYDAYSVLPMREMLTLT